METLVAFEGERTLLVIIFFSFFPHNTNIMFYSWDETQPFARRASRLDPPPPPPPIYMKAERAGRSLLRADWDVDKPRQRAENLDRLPALRATAALRRIMKSCNKHFLQKK